MSYTTSDNSLYKIITLEVIDHWIMLSELTVMLINSFRLIIEICSISALAALIFNKDHLLISLLSLERFMLRLVIIIPVNFLMSSSESIFFGVILLSIGACEARLGLALIVLISRSFGSDKIKSLSLNKC